MIHADSNVYKTPTPTKLGSYVGKMSTTAISDGWHEVHEDTLLLYYHWCACFQTLDHSICL